MKITAISDLHGDLCQIDPCDVLCICGDTVPLNIQRNRNTSHKWFITTFFDWVYSLPCSKVIMIGGNHDFFFQWINRFGVREIISDYGMDGKLIYLENSMYIYNDVSFYGCPNVENLYGWAFYTYSGLEYFKIPDCDILLTHQPPDIGQISTCKYGNWGSITLKNVLEQRKIKYHFCGHIHEGSHFPVMYNGIHVQNVSYKNEDYDPAFEPASIEI